MLFTRTLPLRFIVCSQVKQTQGGKGLGMSPLQLIAKLQSGESTRSEIAHVEDPPAPKVCSFFSHTCTHLCCQLLVSILTSLFGVRLFFHRFFPFSFQIPKSIFSPELDLFDIDEEEVARQLTLVQHDLLKRISV
jgi:hypothetical protein